MKPPVFFDAGDIQRLKTALAQTNAFLVKESLEGPVPSLRGTVVMFSGATIPEGWQLADGTNGTPDLTAEVSPLPYIMKL